MKIFCCYTKAHEPLLHDYFIPSLPADFDLHSTMLELSGPGDFLSAEYLACLHRKIDLVIASLLDHPGEIIAWSDIDIVFLRPVAAELDTMLAGSGKDILFQREGSRVADVNGGFYVLRAIPRITAFFEKVRESLAAHPGWLDQTAINQLLQDERCDLLWGYLPPAYYARTHGWPPPRDIALYHANETVGSDAVGRKIRQFQELQWVRKYGLPALAWSCFTKIPKRLKRLWRESQGK